MTTPVEIPVRAVGVEAAKAELRSVKAAYLELEQLGKETAARAKKHTADTIAQIGKLRAEEGFAGGIGRSGGGELLPASGRSSKQGFGNFVADQFGLGSILETAKSFGAAGLAVTALKGGIDLATDALRQFGGFVLSDVVKPALALRTQAQQVANASGGRLTAADVEGRARGAGLRSNMAPERLIEAASVFQDLTGESKLSFEMLDIIGTLSKGRGFDTKQLAGMGAALYQPGMQKGELEKLMLNLTAQGDVGSITLGQIAKLGGRLTVPAASFTGGYADRIAMSGALLQTGRKGFGSLDRLATSYETFVQDTLRSGKNIGGKHVYQQAGTGVTMIQDVPALIAELFRKTSGNLEGMKKLGYTETGARFVGAYKETYTGAFEKAREGGQGEKEARDTAAKAVEDFIRSMATATTSMDAESAKRDAVLRTDGEKWDAAINRIKDRLLAVMPEISKFIDTFASNAPTIASASVVLAKALLALAKWIVDVVPMTDSRMKRGLEKEIEKADIGAKVSETGEKSAALKAKIAADKAKGLDTSVDEGSLKIQEDKRIKLEESLKRLEAPEKLLSESDVLAQFAQDEIRQSVVKGITAEPGTYDIDKGELTHNLGSAQKRILMQYQDQQLAKQEETVKGGATSTSGGIEAMVASLQKAADAAAKAAKNLDAMGDAAAHANRSQPYGTGGK